MRFILTTLVFGIFSKIAPGQVSQPARYEEKFKYSDGVFTLISLKREGLVLVRDREKYESGKKIWEAIILDTALTKKKRVEFTVESRNKLIGFEYTPGQVYLLFRQGDTEKNDLELVELNLDRDDIPHYVINPELPLRLTHFSKAGSNIILGGYVSKEPSIILYSLSDKNIKVLPGFFQSDAELVDLRVNENNTFNVVLIDRALREERKAVFQTYDEKGALLLEDKVNIQSKLTLQTGITSLLKREDLMLLGTWGEGNSKQSNGFYALNVDPFADQKIQYVSFGELSRFLDYQKENRAKRIQENTRDVLQAGGIPNYTSYVMPYRVEEYQNGFLLFAEVYNPSSSGFNNYGSPYGPYYYNPYYSPYGWYYPGYGRLYSRPYSYGYNSRTNDEIKTFESVVVSFDEKGKVQWDYSENLEEVKRSSMEQVSDFNFTNNKLVFLHKKESELKIKSVVVNSDESEEMTEKIRTYYPEDEIRSEKEGEGGSMYWYNNSFYVWGYQTIRNNTQEERVRDVFYINKIEIN
ncbi:MAG TPA: hypothetical protein VFW11_17180 [Cyclobacteriaceae bacterium]|nr:hypothetical protein [Cyclobacteriaceae bacterium]